MHDIRTEFLVRVSRTSFLDGELGSSVVGLRIHLPSQNRKLTGISRIFKQYHVVRVQTDGTHVSVFVK